MSIVFYISGHGFGHASRQVEIINALGRMLPGQRFLIRSAVNASLLRRTLDVPYELRSGPCDTGIVQKTSVEHDDPETVRAAVEFYSSFEEKVATEASALADDDVHLVVGDIPPLAFVVADRIGVPAIAIGNFTWDWIYETHPGMAETAPWLVPLLRSAYRHAGLGLELPFGGGFDVFPSTRRIPLVVRQPTHNRIDTRDYFQVPPDRPAVLLSFGGYGIPSLDVTTIDATDWTLVLTDRIVSMDSDGVPANVIYIPEKKFQDSDFRYEDLVSAVDVVVSKPGYGIVSECIAYDTPLLYTSRGVFREYDLFVREMPRYTRCRFINQADLFAGRWREGLEGVRAQPPAPEQLATNGAELAAEALAQAVGA